MKRLLLSTALLGLIASPAFAQINNEKGDEIISLGQIIGSAELNDLTSPASILTQADIDNRNQTYVSELLRSMPGIAVSRSGPGGALTQIRMRGNEASHVLVLIDGVEVANPTAGEFDLSGVRASDVVKIEVLRGEQSALYGSDAVGCLINIITNAGNRQRQWNASLEAGSFDTLDGHVSGVIPIGGASLSLGVNALTTEGYDISGLDDLTGDGEKDGSTSQAVNLGLNNLDIGGIVFSAKYGASELKTEFDEDLFFSGRLNDTQSHSLIDTQSARIDAKFEAGGFENLITLSGHDIETDSRASFPSVSEGTRRKASWAIKKGFDAHSLTILGETESETYNISPSFAFAPTRPKNTNYGLAGDYRYTGEVFTLTASARQDFNDRFDDALTWKLGGSYDLSSFGGRIRASVGTGVKNPSLIELFGFFPEASFVGNPDLTPEQSFGYNIGYEQTLMDEALTLTADYFRSDLEDEIFTDFSSFPFLPRNRTTDSKREGVELTADWKMADSFGLYGSASFLDAEENGVKEIRRPEFMASLTASWSPLEALTLTASADHTGSQIDTDFSTFAPVELDAFTLMGLNAAFDVNDVLTLTLRGENLLDEDYEEVVGYRSQGRGVFAGLRARFN